MSISQGEFPSPKKLCRALHSASATSISTTTAFITKFPIATLQGTITADDATSCVILPLKFHNNCCCQQQTIWSPEFEVPNRASNEGYQKFRKDFTIMEKASTRAFFWLKAPTII